MRSIKLAECLRMLAEYELEQATRPALLPLSRGNGCNGDNEMVRRLASQRE